MGRMAVVFARLAEGISGLLFGQKAIDKPLVLGWLSRVHA